MSGAEFVFVSRRGDCTADLQSSIDECATSSTKLVLGDGVHNCAGLRLKSGLHLHFSDKAVLKLQEGYDSYQSNEVSVIAESSNRAMIVASGQRDIKVSGSGVIEASGASYIVGELEEMGTHIPAEFRPRTFVVENCENVSLENFTIKNSPMWTIHLICSKGLSLKSVRVDNDRKMPNTDGVVVDACENVEISSCHITTADDGVVLKTSGTEGLVSVGDCRAIRVTHCKLESESCAVKLGTESYGAFEDIVFADCDISRSNRAIGIFSRDGGVVSNVAFQRISVECKETPEGFWGSGEAITVNCVDRRQGRLAGKVQDILFEDISGSMEGAVNLVADSAAGIENVTFRRVHLRQALGAFDGAKYDVRPTHFDLEPSPDAAGRANAWIKDEDGNVIGLVPYPEGQPGFFSSNVGGLICEDVVIDRPDALPQSWNAGAFVILQGQPVVWS